MGELIKLKNLFLNQNKIITFSQFVKSFQNTFKIILDQQHYGYANTTSTTCVIPKYQLQVIQANTKLAIRHMDYLKTFVRSYNSSCSHALEASGRMYNPSLRSFKHPCSHALDSPGGIREASSSPPIRRTLILVRESDEHYEY